MFARAVLGFASLVTAPIWAGPLDHEPAGVHGEGAEDTEHCHWPNVAAYGIHCSAALIHPRVYVTAAHCYDGSAGIRLGNRPLANTLPYGGGGCYTHPQADGVNAYDITVCVASEDCDIDIIYAPPLMGCERRWLQPGQDVVTVGYGSGLKRSVEARFLGWQYDMLVTEVAPNFVCSGDSGGPTLIQLPDGSWRTIGITSGGQDVEGTTCVDPILSVELAELVPWIEATTGIDVTPCSDRDGNWEPGPECGGFIVDPKATGDWWAGGCSTTLSDPSPTCEEIFPEGSLPPEPEPEPDGCACTLDDSAPP